MEAHLARVGVQGHIRRPATLESLREEAGASTHVEHEGAREWVPPIHLSGGILG